MPELRRKPRRRLRSGTAPDDFKNEIDVRTACAEVRALYPSAELAEASVEWLALRPRVARWVRRIAVGLPVIGADEHALRIARIYLTRPEFLPGLPPPNIDQ
jgi:hypothetical protein